MLWCWRCQKDTEVTKKQFEICRGIDKERWRAFRESMESFLESSCCSTYLYYEVKSLLWISRFHETHLILSRLPDSWQTPDILLKYPWLTPDWLLTDSQQTFGRLTINPATEIGVSIWRAVWISSPNLESFSNQLSKFCYYYPPKNSPHRLLTNSQQTPGVWLLTHLNQTSKQSMRFIGWWHQVSIWRAVQISSAILVTNRLLINGPPTDVVQSCWNFAQLK